MTTVQVPEGVPPLLKLALVVKVTGMSERTVRGWLERGKLPHVQPSGRKGGRLIPASALAEFADASGCPLDWEAAL